MTLEERLKEIEARANAAKTTWCQLMPGGYATRETGPKRCACGGVGFPYEHRPWIDPDVPALLRMLRLAIQQRDVAFSYAYKPRAYHVPEANEDLLKAGER